MRKVSIVVLVLTIVLMVFVGTAGAQDPVPSVTLVPSLDTGTGVCTVEVFVNDISDSDGQAPIYGPFNGYELGVVHANTIDVSSTPSSGWFTNSFDSLLFAGGASGCPADLGANGGGPQPEGTCFFSYFQAGVPAVVGSGPIQELTFTPGPGTMSLVDGEINLSTESGEAIVRTIGGSINMATCASPTAIGEPLSFAGSAGGGNMALLALAGLAMVSLAGLGLSRKRSDT